MGESRLGRRGKLVKIDNHEGRNASCLVYSSIRLCLSHLSRNEVIDVNIKKRNLWHQTLNKKSPLRSSFENSLVSRSNRFSQYHISAFGPTIIVKIEPKQS